MILSELLAERGITSALIVDDVCDAVPTTKDIDPGSEFWPNFNDDLLEEHRAKILKEYPLAIDKNFNELIDDDDYIAAIWNLREELGDICTPVFEVYLRDQDYDQQYIDHAVSKLEAVGLQCKTSGRDFIDAAQDADLILIDLFFYKVQDDSALGESKAKLRTALDKRRDNPPLVILMSRSTRLEGKRDEFRDEVGLLDSAFRIIRKSDLEDSTRLERQLERLSKNALDSRKLAIFFNALEEGMENATARTLELFRRLRLSDVGQIQQLLLSAEGEPTGSYLVDVFDRVLQHEIEREAGIINAAKVLNEFSSTNYTPPYVFGSPELQELVERLLTQNSERLQLSGALESSVAFGDILKMANNADVSSLKAELLIDMDPEKVLLVLTPACDLQRREAPHILLLVGTLKPLNVDAWSYKSSPRTPAIRIDNTLHWISWDLKHIDTVSHEQLNSAFKSDNLEVVVRLREAHALELQQQVLSGLGRIGLVATLPATFLVDLEVYYANSNGVPTRLEIKTLSEGAVCFSGRDEKGNSILRLVITEHSCDEVIAAFEDIQEDQISDRAKQALNHLKESDDLWTLLTEGIDLKGAKDNGWFHIPSLSNTQRVPKFGLLARNYEFGEEALANKDLAKAGVILLVRDRNQNETLS